MDKQDITHMHQAKTNTDNGVVCPLCGESNGCTYAAGKPHSECWCNHASFPEGVLERIPAEHRLKSCICQRCLDSYVREQV